MYCKPSIHPSAFECEQEQGLQKESLLNDDPQIL
jgi:hypothetical protein